ncbi:hypothetical protein [Microbulbifer halophilus]|uniref:Uncharacterized protein n=1 Tax=Microbulbifer halophilus TaxID=453963 RepID=A0ABW5EDJ2_9GAMM|nr:hypothetical protein [Microbulbifer halophilus]MCW8126263.1 hypothetical protein [Microbulbifer halophilus]
MSRESGHRLYLTSLTVGLLFLPPAWLILQVSEWACSFAFVNNYCIKISELEYIIILSLWTLVFGYLTAYAYNKFKKHAKAEHIIREWRKNDFDSIYLRAQLDFKPLAISLDTGKVYVGMPVLSREPGSQDSHISILPIYSGYRTDKDLKFVLATRYESVAGLVSRGAQFSDDAKDFYMALPRERIVSIHIFNNHLYKQVDASYTSKKAHSFETLMQRLQGSDKNKSSS